MPEAHKRETFSSFFGLLMSMIGVAVGLGAVWRFPYMVGRFGGSAFVLFYLAVVIFVGIPGLMAEWSLGRTTLRGTWGAFDRGGLPGGKIVGVFLFFIVFWATGYYSNAVGWVGIHALGELARALHIPMDASAILPPEHGCSITSFLMQFGMTGFIILMCGMVLRKGLRKGIERISKVIVPALFIILALLILRSVTLSGAGAGMRWYIGGFHWHELTPSVMAAALGMAFFSMSLGGTFMVIYGSYLDKRQSIPRNALLTGFGAMLAGILSGFVIFPAIFSFGMKPDSGPSLIFSTLPGVFSRMPAGWLFGLLFFLGLFGAAFLSDVAAFEVLVGGIVDNTAIPRPKAVMLVCSLVMLLAVPPMINMKIFFVWDLTFGSGMQAFGSLLAVITLGWCIKSSDGIHDLGHGTSRNFTRLLYWWIRLIVPAAILFVGINWLLDSVFGIKLIGTG